MQLISHDGGSCSLVEKALVSCPHAKPGFVYGMTFRKLSLSVPQLSP